MMKMGVSPNITFLSFRVTFHWTVMGERVHYPLSPWKTARIQWTVISGLDQTGPWLALESNPEIFTNFGQKNLGLFLGHSVWSKKMRFNEEFSKELATSSFHWWSVLRNFLGKNSLKTTKTAGFFPVGALVVGFLKWLPLNIRTVGFDGISLFQT